MHTRMMSLRFRIERKIPNREKLSLISRKQKISGYYTGVIDSDYQINSYSIIDAEKIMSGIQRPHGI